MYMYSLKFDDPKCQEQRRLLEPSEDNKCSAGSRAIEDHLILNYIRKDKIPCWNCNLD